MHSLLQINVTVDIDGRVIVISDIILVITIDHLVDVFVNSNGMRELAIVEVNIISDLFLPLLIPIFSILDALV